MSRTAIIFLFVFVAYLAISGADSDDKDSERKHSSPKSPDSWPNKPDSWPNKPDGRSGPDSPSGPGGPSGRGADSHDKDSERKHSSPKSPNSWPNKLDSWPNKPDSWPNKPDGRSGPDSPSGRGSPSGPDGPNWRNGLSSVLSILRGSSDGSDYCGPNERLLLCGPPRHCQSTCKDPYKVCPGVCIGGCVCIRGYVRNSFHQCVPFDVCE